VHSIFESIGRDLHSHHRFEIDDLEWARLVSFGDVGRRC
jgi:hypothetical protein